MNKPYVPFILRFGPVRDIPRLEPLFVRVADVADASDFPNIAEAIEHARSQMGGRDGG
jgi:hypothetical protein